MHRASERNETAQQRQEQDQSRQRQKDNDNGKNKKSTKKPTKKSLPLATYVPLSVSPPTKIDDQRMTEMKNPSPPKKYTRAHRVPPHSEGVQNQKRV